MPGAVEDRDELIRAGRLRSRTDGDHPVVDIAEAADLGARKPYGPLLGAGLRLALRDERAIARHRARAEVDVAIARAGDDHVADRIDGDRARPFLAGTAERDRPARLAEHVVTEIVL